jgi:PadR family transcriptional regulator AphA
MSYGAAVTTLLPDLSLADWMVLGVVAEEPTHGWPVVRELSATGSLGRIWTVARPVVYRSLATLEANGLTEHCGDAPGVRGPQRSIVRVTRLGRAALRRWLRTPVTHVRDVRSELLVKLALLDRAGEPNDELVERQISALEPVLRAVSDPPAQNGFDAVLAGWRREQARAVERFLRGLQA